MTKATIQNTLAVAGLGRFDRVYSTVHGRFVRFMEWTDQEWARVADSDTCEPLPDEVHRTQLVAH